ncbi:hypothetical protein RchiOBHm_Chr3g0481911 [Rosa chinensis]|uniref:Uncharacterized protein n=1 Tax=Rosa chinensis TaxID=74649 RepID=A0A2P6RE19_ROSCH|nr:hypothetical protein RchiOBHm_Chr3g0481911 [Rosa chinensis]
MFSTEGTNETAMSIILQTVQRKVTPEMNNDLLAPYTDDEIRAAAFQMHPSKAPGPDGM